jgi:hypothetical protein
MIRDFRNLPFNAGATYTAYTDINHKKAVESIGAILNQMQQPLATPYDYSSQYLEIKKIIMGNVINREEDASSFVSSVLSCINPVSYNEFIIDTKIQRFHPVIGLMYENNTTEPIKYIAMDTKWGSKTTVEKILSNEYKSNIRFEDKANAQPKDRITNPGPNGMCTLNAAQQAKWVDKDCVYDFIFHKIDGTHRYFIINLQQINQGGVKIFRDPKINLTITFLSPLKTFLLVAAIVHTGPIDVEYTSGHYVAYVFVRAEGTDLRYRKYDDQNYVDYKIPRSKKFISKKIIYQNPAQYPVVTMLLYRDITDNDY